MMNFFVVIVLILFIPNKSFLEEIEKPQTKKNFTPKIERMNSAKLDSLIKNRNGKILFLNVWATWCKPCVEEFPDIVNLHEKYKNSKVDITALSVDFEDELEKKVIPFLKKNEVEFKTFIGNFKNDEELINKLNENWRGDVPATLIYDKNGKLKKFFTGKKSLKEFSEAIESLKMN